MAHNSMVINPQIRPALRPALPALALAALAAALAGLVALAASWGIVRLVDGAAVTAVAWVCGAWLAAAALSTLAAWLGHAAEARFEARLRREVSAHLLRLPADRLPDYPADRLRRLASDDIAALHHMVAHLPGELAALVVVPLSAAVLLGVLGGPAALLALIPGVLAAMLYLGVIPPLSARYGSERNRVMGEITGAVDEYAYGIQVFRSTSGAGGALADFTGATRRFTRDMLVWVRRVATPAALAVALLQAAASYAIAYAVSADRGTAVLAATLLFSLAVVTPALRLGHGLDYVVSGRAAAGRVGSLLAEPLLPAGERRLGEANDGVGVTVDAVTVVVREEASAAGPGGGLRLSLNACTMHAPPGALTALTGPSGVGKSTLLRVIAGLQLPRLGSVRLRGIAVTELTEEARADAVLLIPQDARPLPASVRDNLLLVRSDATDGVLREALGRAQLPVELDADAAQLSGGEQQRLALARAFVSGAPVILLDEPTAGLDEETAGVVWTALLWFAREEARTVIAVTHDPRLAALADGVVKLAAPTAAQEGQRI